MANLGHLPLEVGVYSPSDAKHIRLAMTAASQDNKQELPGICQHQHRYSLEQEGKPCSREPAKDNRNTAVRPFVPIGNFRCRTPDLHERPIYYAQFPRPRRVQAFPSADIVSSLMVRRGCSRFIFSWSIVMLLESFPSVSTWSHTVWDAAYDGLPMEELDDDQLTVINLTRGFPLEITNEIMFRHLPRTHPPPHQPLSRGPSFVYGRPLSRHQPG